MKLSQPVDPDEPMRSLRHWAEELSAEQGGRSTLQYELINALLNLYSQGIRDVWANWSDASVKMLDLLRAFLPYGRQYDRILADLNAIQVAAETDGYAAYPEFNRLPSDLMHWCNERPDWIRLPEGFQSWFDVPRDALSLNAGRAISPPSTSVVPVRGLPDPSRYKPPFRWQGLVFCAASITLGFIFEFPAWISFPGILIATLLAHWLWSRLHHCPQCNGRLVSRRIDLDESGSRYRQLYDCSRCGTSWDAGEHESFD